MPPMWIYYTETPDLDAALERAKKRGATVMNGPMDVPGGGRIVQIMTRRAPRSHYIRRPERSLKQ